MSAIITALKEHRRVFRQIKHNRYVYEVFYTAERVAIALLLVGLASVVGVLIKAIGS